MDKQIKLCSDWLNLMQIFFNKLSSIRISIGFIWFKNESKSFPSHTLCMLLRRCFDFGTLQQSFIQVMCRFKCFALHFPAIHKFSQINYALLEKYFLLSLLHEFTAICMDEKVLDLNTINEWIHRKFLENAEQNGLCRIQVVQLLLDLIFDEHASFPAKMEQNDNWSGSGIDYPSRF